MSFETVVFNPRELVNQVLRSVRPLVTHKAVRLLSEVARNVPPRLIGDPHRLRQMLVNLCNNATKVVCVRCLPCAASEIASHELLFLFLLLVISACSLRTKVRSEFA